jgi:dTDP-4-amino-4,6-dideoxygalactose transaminase
MMSSMECASVLIGLKYADQWHQRRQQIADYLINFSRHPTALDISLPQHTYSKLVFQSLQRDLTIEKFKNLKIDCIVHYNTLINNESLYQTLGTYNKSDYLKSISFTVPNQHTLTDDEVERIAKALQ